MIKIIDKAGGIAISRTCAPDFKKDGCHLSDNYKKDSEVNEDCTCKTDLCNDKPIRDIFPDHPDNVICWHCSSTIQPWCAESNLNSHIKDPGVLKSCHSARCVTEITGILSIY